MLVNSLKNYYHQQPSRMDIVRLDDHIQMDLVTDDSTIERGFDGEASMALRGQYLLGHVYKSHDFPPATPSQAANDNCIFNIISKKKARNFLPQKSRISDGGFKHVDYLCHYCTITPII